MGGIVLVILVLAVVMAATVAIALLVLRSVGDKAERRSDDLRAEVERLGEEWVVPFEGAVYQGGGHGSAASRGHGVLGLTDRRILFLPIAGEPLSVPCVRIATVRAEDRRRDAGASHRHRLVVALDDESELGFLVDDTAEWVEALGPRDQTPDAAET